jgi:hypothetical protein
MGGVGGGREGWKRKKKRKWVEKEEKGGCGEVEDCEVMREEVRRRGRKKKKGGSGIRKGIG